MTDGSSVKPTDRYRRVAATLSVRTVSTSVRPSSSASRAISVRRVRPRPTPRSETATFATTIDRAPTPPHRFASKIRRYARCDPHRHHRQDDCEQQRGERTDFRPRRRSRRASSQARRSARPRRSCGSKSASSSRNARERADCAGPIHHPLTRGQVEHRPESDSSRTPLNEPSIRRRKSSRGEAARFPERPPRRGRPPGQAACRTDVVRRTVTASPARPELDAAPTTPDPA